MPIPRDCWGTVGEKKNWMGWSKNAEVGGLSERCDEGEREVELEAFLKSQKGRGGAGPARNEGRKKKKAGEKWEMMSGEGQGRGGGRRSL